jgi:hypothetical protein
MPRPLFLAASALLSALLSNHVEFGGTIKIFEAPVVRGDLLRRNHCACDLPRASRGRCRRAADAVIAVTNCTIVRPPSRGLRTSARAPFTNGWMTSNLHQETPMSIRSSVFAFAAIATLASTALTPTSASAHFGFGGVGHLGGFGHLGAPEHFGHFTFGHYNWYHGNYWHHNCYWYCVPHPHYGRWWWPRYRFGFRYGGVNVVSAPTTVSTPAPASAPAPAPTGSCLTKRELPDGSALFRDRCTGEQAESQPQGGPPGQR